MAEAIRKGCCTTAATANVQRGKQAPSRLSLRLYGGATLASLTSRPPSRLEREEPTAASEAWRPPEAVWLFVRMTQPPFYMC